MILNDVVQNRAIPQALSFIETGKLYRSFYLVTVQVPPDCQPVDAPALSAPNIITA